MIDTAKVTVDRLLHVTRCAPSSRNKEFLNWPEMHFNIVKFSMRKVSLNKQKRIWKKKNIKKKEIEKKNKNKNVNLISFIVVAVYQSSLYFVLFSTQIVHVLVLECYYMCLFGSDRRCSLNQVHIFLTHKSINNLCNLKESWKVIE